MQIGENKIKESFILRQYFYWLLLIFFDLKIDSVRRLVYNDIWNLLWKYIYIYLIIDKKAKVHSLINECEKKDDNDKNDKEFFLKDKKIINNAFFSSFFFWNRRMILFAALSVAIGKRKNNKGK